MFNINYIFKEMNFFPILIKKNIINNNLFNKNINFYFIPIYIFFLKKKYNLKKKYIKKIFLFKKKYFFIKKKYFFKKKNNIYKKKLLENFLLNIKDNYYLIYINSNIKNNIKKKINKKYIFNFIKKIINFLFKKIYFKIKSILILGKFAANFLLKINKNNSINKLRNKFFYKKNIPLIITYSINYIYNNPIKKKYFYNDINLILFKSESRN